MAHLEDADLRDAKLNWADLIGANLSDTDLSMADLREADLRDADLHDANLHDADLSDTDLSMAELDDADLEEADLRDANLKWTKLNGANLSGADLGMANLSGAELRGAILSGADLTGANLCDAILDGALLDGVTLEGADMSMASLSDTEIGFANFINVDLSNIKGSDTVRFTGPSEISVSTIFKSRGKIPEVFLRGCGMPDSFIGFVKSLAETEPEQFSCFIAFSPKEREFVERLEANLQSSGIRCWQVAEHHRKPARHHNFPEELVRYHEKLLLVLSEESLKSGWLKTELSFFREREETEGRNIILPVSLLRLSRLEQWKCFDPETGRDLAAEVRRLHIPIFAGWEKSPETYGTAFASLLESFRTEKPE